MGIHQHKFESHIAQQLSSLLNVKQELDRGIWIWYPSRIAAFGTDEEESSHEHVDVVALLSSVSGAAADRCGFPLMLVKKKPSRGVEEKKARKLLAYFREKRSGKEKRKRGGGWNKKRGRRDVVV